MLMYAVLYRLGFTPWERYGSATAASFGALLDREAAERSRPLGRALDLGCGRGQRTRELAKRGWDVVGIDDIPRAVEAATRHRIPGATFVSGDVTELEKADLGTFDFFLDSGCFHHLDAAGRLATGRGVSALARPGATLLMLEFQPTRIRSLAGAVTAADVEAAFPDWDMLSITSADTTGLGWPLAGTAPQWYRLRRPR